MQSPRSGWGPVHEVQIEEVLTAPGAAQGRAARSSRMRANPPPVLYVDVDDTLVRSFGSKRIPMTAMVSLVRGLKERGAQLYYWSSGGAAYARSTTAELGLEDCFEGFLPKPQMLLDDVSVQRWSVVHLHPSECSGLTPEEVLARLPGSPRG